MPKKSSAMTRKMMRASRDADPKRPTEPRPAQGRDTQVARTAPPPDAVEISLMMPRASADARK